MRFELVLLLVVVGLCFHIHTDGKYTKQLFHYKKYYQMAGIVIGAFVLYVLFKKNPIHAKNIIMTSNDYLKYLPVDKNTTSMLSPILDFTSRNSFAQEGGQYPVVRMPSPNDGRQQNSTQRMMHSGKKSTKRSVSETKKKFVASRQNWKCGDCSEQLNAWFEVDHKTRLEYGGSNHVDNLLALCRECHGKKTTIENL